MLGLAGQIKSFHGPHLACGPYVVHACSSWSSHLKDVFVVRPIACFSHVLLPGRGVRVLIGTTHNRNCAGKYSRTGILQIYELDVILLVNCSKGCPQIVRK